MVEQQKELNYVFASLSDPTRRDILRQIKKKSLSVRQIAANYPLTFAAVAKHLDVLHRARLISKRRRGKERVVSLRPQTLMRTSKYLENYRELWEDRLDKLGKYLKTINKKGK